MSSFVSVIMPVYNTERYVSEAIQSVIAQTFSDWELILIDDGSTDASGKICDQHASRDSRIHVIHSDNFGVSHARNLGITHAKGNWIFFADSDDILCDNCLELLVSNSSHADVVIGAFRECIEQRVFSVGRETLFIGSEKAFAQNFIHCYRKFMFQCVWGKLYRKSIIRVMFDETISYGEDLIFNLSNLVDFEGIRIIPDIVYQYFKRKNTSCLSSGSIENRLQISYGVMKMIIRRFPNDTKLTDYLTGKFTIHTYNHLIRVLSNCGDTSSGVAAVQKVLADKLFLDPLVQSAAAPLPELKPVWEAIISRNANAVASLMVQPNTRPIMSDSPGMISVILPVYNMATTVERAIQSIVNQTYERWELIIIDDGSTDGVGNVVNHYLEKEPRIRFVQTTNQGVSHARNAGIDMAVGEWVAFLDGDDAYEPEAFAWMIANGKGGDLVCCSYFDTTSRSVHKVSEMDQTIYEIPDNDLCEQMWKAYFFAVVWGKLYRRSKIKTLFDPKFAYGEDTLFNLHNFPNMNCMVLLKNIGYRYSYQKKKMKPMQLYGTKTIFESVIDLYSDNDTMKRKAYLAYVRLIRSYILEILDSDLTDIEKRETIAQCRAYLPTNSRYDPEQYLFEKNLIWWRQIKSGEYEVAVADLRVIQKERERNRVLH